MRRRRKSICACGTGACAAAPTRRFPEHCECADPADHLANLDTAIDIADRRIDEAPPHQRQVCEMGAGQPRRHRAVIAAKLGVPSQDA